MTRFPVATVAVAVVTFICTSDLGVAAQKVRTLRQNDQPIVSRLLPDDQVVLIEHLMGPPRPSPFTMTRENELKQLARMDEIVVIHQAKPLSFFVMNGTWLNTRVTARVIQTLKTGQLATTPGTVIEFEHEGGELDVNGVVVRSAAGVSFENNSRYLVALRFDTYFKRWQPVVMFELDNLGVLRGTRRRDGTTSTSALHGLSLAEVADAISKGAQ
jgi:hypothetical protein